MRFLVSYKFKGDYLLVVFKFRAAGVSMSGGVGAFQAYLQPGLSDDVCFLVRHKFKGNYLLIILKIPIQR